MTALVPSVFLKATAMYLICLKYLHFLELPFIEATVALLVPFLVLFFFDPDFATFSARPATW